MKLFTTEMPSHVEKLANLKTFCQKNISRRKSEPEFGSRSENMIICGKDIMEDRVLSPGAKWPRFRVYYLLPRYFSLAFPLIVSFKIQARDDFTFSFILFCDQTFNSYLEESIPKYKSVPARESGNKLEQLLSKRALNRI